MEQQKQILRFGTIIIVFAISLRLLGGGILSPFVTDSRFLSFLVYLQTGRPVRIYDPAPSKPELNTPQTAPPTTEPSVPETTVPTFEIPVFSPADLEEIRVKDNSKLNPDLEKLLLSGLNWDLTGNEPTVLILHTHATECYTPQPGEDFEQYNAFRTLDENYNMVSIGKEVADILETAGIRVIHDTSYHDYPSYNRAYANARKFIQAYLKKYPSIQFIIDIHRDASADLSNQMTTTGTVGGQKSAQLMMVVGTNQASTAYPWQKNLALALKMSVLLEQTDPGLTRYVSLRSERFNMDLCPGSILAEVGAAGNSHAEAILAAQALARSIIALAKGANI